MVTTLPPRQSSFDLFFLFTPLHLLLDYLSLRCLFVSSLSICLFAVYLSLRCLFVSSLSICLFAVYLSLRCLFVSSPPIYPIQSLISILDQYGYQLLYLRV
jgi:hypothetical protein